MKKILILIIFMFVLSSIVNADDSIETLEKKLQTVTGKEKIEVLVNLSKALNSKSPKKAIEYAKKALSFLKQYKDIKLEGRAFRYIGISNMYLNNLDKAITFHEKSAESFLKISDKKSLGASYANIGIVYNKKSDYTSALKYYEKAIKLFKEIKSLRLVSIILNNMGTIHFVMGNLEKSLNCHLRALKIDEKRGDKLGIANNLNNIGHVYNDLDQYKSALIYYNRAKKIFKSINQLSRFASCIENTGIVYQAMNKSRKALNAYNEALEIKMKINDKTGMSISFNNIGYAYKNLKEYDKSLINYQKSLEINKELKDKLNYAFTLQNIGEIYTEKKDYKKAHMILNEAFEILKKLGNKNLLKDFYLYMSDLYEKQKNYKEGLEYYKKHIEVKDKILNKSSNDKIVEMQTKYETEKKEKEITLLSKNNLLLEKDNQIKKLEIVQQGFKTKLFIIGFILVLVILILLFLRYRKLFAFWKKKSHIGSYRLLNRIGSGGMAVVFKGFHVKDKSKEIAIKILKEDINTDLNQKKRFFNEAQVLKSINHENIIKIFEIGEHNNQLFIAMEYIKGNTLSHYIDNNNDLLIKNSITIMRQIINAIVELHKQEIIHRDLKPDNIMLYKEGEQLNVKLLDFGLAKTQSLNSLTKTGMVLGTIYYMPPEQLFYSVFSFAGDIYSLGIIFYEMLTGEKPFNGETTGEIMFEILNKDPKPIIKKPDLPEEINTIIFKMINKEPQNRPDIISLQKEFDQFSI